MELTDSQRLFFREQTGRDPEEISFCVVLSFVVRKLASKAVTAHPMFPERFAFLSSITSLRFIPLKCELMVSMGKLAFVPVGAEAHF